MVRQLRNLSAKTWCCIANKSFHIAFHFAPLISRCDSFADDEEKLHIIKMHLQEYIPSSLQVCNLQFHLSSEQIQFLFGAVVFSLTTLAVMPFPGYWELLPSNYAVRCRFLFLKDLTTRLHKKERKESEARFEQCNCMLFSAFANMSTDGKLNYSFRSDTK